MRQARSRNQRRGASSSNAPPQLPVLAVEEKTYRMIGSFRDFSVDGVMLHRSRRIDDVDETYGLIEWKDNIIRLH